MPHTRKKTKKLAKHEGKILTMVSHVSPVAPKLRTRLKYSTVYGVSISTSVDQRWRLNSLFDPDATGTGGQPTGFDQLSALYNRYRVYKTRWIARVVGLTYGFVVNFVPTNETTSLGSLSNSIHSLSLPYAHWTTASAGAKAEVIRGSIDLPLLNGRTHNQYFDDDVTSAAINASPSETLDLHMVVFSLDGTTACTGAIILVLEFDCEFFDPVQHSSSFGSIVRPPKVIGPEESKQVEASTCLKQ